MILITIIIAAIINACGCVNACYEWNNAEWTFYHREDISEYRKKVIRLEWTIAGYMRGLILGLCLPIIICIKIINLIIIRYLQKNNKI